MKITKIKRDHRLAAGAWVNEIPGLDDLALKVLPLDADEVKRAERRALEAVPPDRRLSGLAPSDEREIARAKASAALIDWANFEGEDGEKVPHSTATAGKFIADPDFAPFVEAVIYAATVVKTIGTLEIGCISKN